MRIIQGRDYYDNALAFGRDETIVFVRPKDLWFSDSEVAGFDKSMAVRWNYHFEFKDAKNNDVISVPRNSTIYRYKNMEIVINPILVLFCGKVYHGLMTEVTTEGRYLDMETTFHWTEDGFVRWLERYGLVVHKVASSYWHFDRREVELSFMFEITDAPKATLDWMIAQKIVVAIRGKTTRWFEGGQIKPWAINSDGLKGIQFAKAVDPYQAFQTIFMWIGTFLTGTGNEMVQIADSVRVEKHGFDKYSFRKLPEKV